MWSSSPTDRGVEGARPEAAAAAAGPAARGTGSTGTAVRQQDPYARRRGPLMSMIANLERAQREQQEEQERRVRQASARGGAAARLVHDLQQRKADGKQLGIGYGVEWLAEQALAASIGRTGTAGVRPAEEAGAGQARAGP